jgi:predicted DNA-binding transcriptional regulator AlpA
MNELDNERDSGQYIAWDRPPLFVAVADAPKWIGLSPAGALKLAAEDPSFPRLRKITPSGRRVGWIYAELEAWALTRPLAESMERLELMRVVTKRAGRVTVGSPYEPRGKKKREGEKK